MSTGLFNTAVLTTDLAKKSFAGMITRLMPNGAAPLFGMTAMLPQETAVQTEHGFFTKTMLLPEMTTNGVQLIGATTLTVTSTANILPGMIMRVNEGSFENLIINTVSLTDASYCYSRCWYCCSRTDFYCNPMYSKSELHLKKHLFVRMH
jgi:hypothetical protein